MIYHENNDEARALFDGVLTKPLDKKKGLRTLAARLSPA